MSQRDDYVAALLTRVGYQYDNSGPWRCTGAQHSYDCSGLLCWGMNAVGIGYPCSNSELMADDMVAHHTTMTQTEARATKGAWAVRRFNNPITPGDGHIVCSLGDGRTVEAHSHADGVIVGTFDGNRGFTVFGRPPGLTGFDSPSTPSAGGPMPAYTVPPVAHPTAQGYWIVDDVGHVFAYGAAGYHGGYGWTPAPGKPPVVLNGKCVGLTPTPTGDGYWLLTAVGSVYAFGDAHYLGHP